MIRRFLKRIALPYVCGLTLLSVPLAGIEAKAQSNSPLGQTEPNSPGDQTADRTQQSAERQNLNSAEQDLGQTPDQNPIQDPIGENINSTPEPSQNSPDANFAGVPEQNENIIREKPTTTEPTTLQNQGNPVGQADTRSTAEPSRAGGPSSLPATAGELPLVGLVGMLCLTLALGTRVFAKTRR